MKRFVLDARTATPHFPGIGRYVTNLARAMAPLLAPDERLTVIYDPAHPMALPPSPAVETVPLAVSPFSPAQQWAVPQLLRNLPHAPTANRQPPTTTIYHSAYMLMPYRPRLPTILTVYDLIPLRYPAHSTARARLLIRWTTRLALRAARHVIAISEFTRRDFMAEFGLAPQRITAIPLAADPAFKPQGAEAIAALRRKYDLPERFALYLGSNKPHKNLVRLVEAWDDCGLRIGDCGLVIAGAWDARYPEARNLTNLQPPTSNLQSPISNLQPPTSNLQSPTSNLQSPTSNLQPPVWLGPVPETDLPALYSTASVFVFPSLYEGFGLPVLEAMACGVPVICSNTSSLPEVVGEAALLVNPGDAAALADALCGVLSDDRLRGDLRQRGLAQAACFTWTQTAAATLALYRNIHP